MAFGDFDLAKAAQTDGMENGRSAGNPELSAALWQGANSQERKDPNIQMAGLTDWLADRLIVKPILEPSLGRAFDMWLQSQRISAGLCTPRTPENLDTQRKSGCE